MPAVSNTSPILNLAVINRLELLREQFAEVLIPPIVLVGVLLRAKRDGSLDSVEAAMLALRREAGFFIAADLFSDALTEAGER